MDKLVKQNVQLMLDTEAAYRDDLTAAIEAGMMGMLREFERGYSPRQLPTSEALSITKIVNALWHRSMTEAVTFTSDYLNQLGKSTAEVTTRIIQEYVSSIGQVRAAQIIQTTENQIRSLMAGGLARGEAAQIIVNRLIEQIPRIADARSDVITRTETHTTNQFASYALALRSGRVLKKTWNSVNDALTRDFGEVGAISQFNHRIMDQVSVPLGGMFLVPSITGTYEKLLYPGDPNGSAGNVINCRCVHLFSEH